MTQYLLRRILLSIPVLFGILTVTFFMTRMLGDPCKAILGEKATQEVCDRFIKDQGLDQPIAVQFGIYIKQIASGNFGDSIRLSRPVTTLLLERLPTTIELAMSALILAVIIGVPLGIAAALWHNSPIDILTTIGANIGVSMPVFWLGLLLAFMFAIVLKDTPFQLPPAARISPGLQPVPFYEKWGWHVNPKDMDCPRNDTACVDEKSSWLREDSALFPLFQFIGYHYIFNSFITADWKVFVDAVRHMILPAFTLATIPLSVVARMTRSSLLEVLGKDYVRTARAKGARELRVVSRHALRNALLPVATIIGLQLGALLSGAVLTETTFNLAGVGLTLTDAIKNRDFPIIQAFTVVIALGYMVVNLLVDVSYGFLDPRIRLD
jgi:peptide/nickel transport system permease protein